MLGGNRLRWTALAVVVGLACVPTFASTAAGADSTDVSHAPPATRPYTPKVDPLGTVEVKLTRVAKTPPATAFAVRRDDDTIYLALQRGQVVAVRDGRVLRPALLDVSDRVAKDREQGLLGLTFSPDGRRMYVYLTESDDGVVLEEYRVVERGHDAPVRVVRSSRRVVLALAKVHPQHNGGQLAFGPDKRLYVSIGDGGGHGDAGPGHAPEGNGQSLDTLFGKILRIDPRARGDQPYTVPRDNPFASGGGRGEIWAFGLRNPWRFSFDRETGALWIGDVGQDHLEEIDVVSRARAAGANFGWPLLEGTRAFRATSAPGAVGPVWTLWHRAGYCAITGGFVYRGARISGLRGTYVYSDFCDGTIRGLRVEHGKAIEEGSLGIRAPFVAAFGEDARGELYVLSHERGLLRLDRTDPD